MIDVGEILVVGGEQMTVIREGRGPGTATIEVHQAGIAFLERLPRRERCAFCRIRRVLYRIGLRTVLREAEFTEARCAGCWGVRAEEA